MVRFGTFQRHAFHDRADLISALIAHVVEQYYPELDGSGPAALLSAVVHRTARLAARWMAAGFVHGVLNTDNMNITGESFDYGPYRFLPRNDPNFVAAYFDQTGLYAFGRQPAAVFWNLQQLAGTFTLVAPEAVLVEALNEFAEGYKTELRAAMLARLGVTPRSEDEDIELVNAAFRALAEGGSQAGDRMRWEPFFFDWYGGAASEQRALTGARADLYGGEAFTGFRRRLSLYACARPERLQAAYFDRPEPEELLYDEIEALWAPIAGGDDWQPLADKLARIEAARLAWGLSVD